MKKITLIFLCLKLAGTFAQITSTDSIFSAIYSRNHLGFNFGPHVNQKMNIQRNYGSIDYISRYGFGGDFSLNYTFNIKKKHGIKLSYGTGRIPISYKFSLDANKYNLNFDLIHTGVEYNNIYRFFDLEYEFRMKPLNHFFINYTAGIRMSQMWKLFANSSVWHLHNNDPYSQLIFEQIIDIINNKKNFYGHLRFGVSMNFLLPKNNLLRVGIISNFTFLNRDNIGGFYYFQNVNGYDSGGFTTWRMSYIGLDLSYIFTRANQANRKQNKLDKEKIIAH